MTFGELERRRDPRTQAYVPITFRMEGKKDETPAHLLDLSSGGAAMLTTAYDTPRLGQYLDLHFELPTNDEDGESPISRFETGLVVNLRNPDRGVTRIGIRFIQHRRIGSDLFDPIEVLSDHRTFLSDPISPSRWNTAPQPERTSPNAASAF